MMVVSELRIFSWILQTFSSEIIFLFNNLLYFFTIFSASIFSDMTDSKTKPEIASSSSYLLQAKKNAKIIIIIIFLN